uniref:ABC transporter ATP-binding protein n=1 Tax=Catelliglobosispora koreensis TaxID=129052 RepID=UPI00058B75A3
MSLAGGEPVTLLEVTGLSKTFRKGKIRAVDGISLTVQAGDTLGLVGESGCGKSTTGRMLMRLLEPSAGRIIFDGKDITRLGARQLRPLRRDIQMIFQDPFSSLNPRHTVGEIIGTPLKILRPEANVRKTVQEILERVGLAPEHAGRYPHQFSGGQAQRIGIARALVVRPRLIVADEPVSALDVSIQAQIINLMSDLRRDLGLSYIFIAHDLAVVRHVCQRIAVMYLGRVVEIGDREQIYATPAHPYTSALLSAVPIPHPVAERARKRMVLQGDPPSPANPPAGCAFSPRCPKAASRCHAERPALTEVAGRLVACHFPETA